MKVIILNGPPGVGKDTLANNVEDLFGWPKLEFKTALYAETADYYGVDLISFTMLATSRLTKEVALPTLGGISPRQALIHVSEEIIKPKYGKKLFGLKAMDSIRMLDGVTDTVIFSDGGFVEEVECLIEHGCDVHIVQLHAEGFDFGNDSRNYVTVGGANLHKLNVTMGDPMADLNNFIYLFIGETE